MRTGDRDLRAQDQTDWRQLDDLWFHSTAVLCAVVAVVASRIGVEPRSVYERLQR